MTNLVYQVCMVVACLSFVCGAIMTVAVIHYTCETHYKLESWTIAELYTRLHTGTELALWLVFCCFLFGFSLHIASVCVECRINELKSLESINAE